MQLANTDKKSVVVVAVIVSLLVSLLYFWGLALDFSWVASQYCCFARQRSSYRVFAKSDRK